MIEYVLWIILSTRVDGHWREFIEFTHVSYGSNRTSCQAAANILMMAYRVNAKKNPDVHGFSDCQEVMR